MFELEIISSVDSEVQGKRLLKKNALYIGHDSGDIIIRDPSMINEHLYLEINSNAIFIHPHPDVKKYLINGKLATKSKRLKVGDLIQVGTSSIKIINALYEEQINFKDHLTEKLDQLLQQRSPKVAILMDLEGLTKEDDK